jgi:hypothetical protein
MRRNASALPTASRRITAPVPAETLVGLLCDINPHDVSAEVQARVIRTEYRADRRPCALRRRAVKLSPPSSRRQGGVHLGPFACEHARPNVTLACN